MTKEEITKLVIAKLKARPDTQYLNETYLNETIDDAINDVYDFINARSDDDLVSGLVTPIKDICIVRLNLTGAEGLISSSKAGTSESYVDGIPKSIKVKLRKYRKLP